MSLGSRDFKIDAINSKITTQLTAVQTDQTATLNNLKQEQKEQRSILNDHGSLLNTILEKLNSIFQLVLGHGYFNY
ncbi:unnamed protein product [Ambrosiozyma monospora]|uniref:Unnamed protein product n=1 Tax=Ambrosiozyma monospora TaxID=43982 RepID=A0A9W7DFS9_AMBMO|nr:unnamed protein product [Ambrosiozyma monospora]